MEAEGLISTDKFHNLFATSSMLVPMALDSCDDTAKVLNDNSIEEAKRIQYAQQFVSKAIEHLTELRWHVTAVDDSGENARKMVSTHCCLWASGQRLYRTAGFERLITAHVLNEACYGKNTER